MYGSWWWERVGSSWRESCPLKDAIGPIEHKKNVGLPFFATPNRHNAHFIIVYLVSLSLFVRWNLFSVTASCRLTFSGIT